MLAELRVSKNERLTEDVFALYLERPSGFEAEPGQFVHIKIPEETEPLLRRPISIQSLTDDHLVLHIKEVGVVTRVLARLSAGSTVDVMGPLGTAFPKPDPTRRPILVGGGIGTAPIAFLAERLRSGGIIFESFVGFRADAYGLESFGDRCTVHLESEKPGYILEELAERLAQGGDLEIFACGPAALLQGVQKLSAKYRLPAWLSLEERMACAVGACLGCAVLIEESGERRYKKVCKDGPVFAADKVVFYE